MLRVTGCSLSLPRASVILVLPCEYVYFSPFSRFGLRLADSVVGLDITCSKKIETLKGGAPGKQV